MFSKKNLPHTLNGIIFVGLFAMAAIYISGFKIISSMGLSPLIIGIIIGVFYGNTLRQNIPAEWTNGIVFSTKTLLRLGVILYGFRISFSEIQSVGLSGMSVSAVMVFTTFLVGTIVGTRLLKMDKELAMLCASGSSVCGAAAVLATEPVLKSESYKTAIAVGTVVVFGTLFMVLLPVAYRSGLIPLDGKQLGVYIGGITHEVAHVVGAANAISKSVSDYAVIVKMIRVMMLVPLLLGLSWYVSKDGGVRKIMVPWFAVYFIVVIGFNSLNLLNKDMVAAINNFDTFLLTMAMTALGMETNLQKFKNVGIKPFILGLIMALWLIFFGFLAVKMCVKL